MLISLISLKITQTILIREMVNLETTRRVTSNLFHLGKQFVVSSLNNVPASHIGGNTGSTSGNPSAEYILHHWLDVSFAWFQMIVLWHDPFASICAISGLFASFLLLTSLAPRFYSIILLGIFAYNLIKVWFKFIWPEIRVPSENGREDVSRANADKWTHLHPHLMTLDELSQLIKNLMTASKIYLHKLLVLRREKPAAFCLAICSTLSCTAYIGGRVGDLKLIFITTSILISAPGIYLYLLPKTVRDYLKNLISFNELLNTRSHSLSDNESSIPLSPLSSAPIPITPATQSSLSHPKSSSSSLLELFTLQWAIGCQEPTSTQTNASSKSDLERDKKLTDENQQEKVAKINQPVSSDTDGDKSSSQKQPQEVSAESSSNDESASLIDFEDDQHDGFVIL